MSNPFFRFKKFTVHHDRCAMKVGTDGVLLGAWAATSKSNYILDVGTGTGLIALMLAQRTPEAIVDALDIDVNACLQAVDNIKKSPFSGRINVICKSFLEYDTERKYDAIVSNPPYFVNSLKSPEEKRRMARHSDSLPLRSLIKHSKQMLSDNGKIALILPVQLFGEIEFIIATNGLHILRKTDVVSVEGSEAKRFLVELSPKAAPKRTVGTLTLESKSHERTKEYLKLTEDFYL